MRFSFKILVVFIFVFVSGTQTANAQFWKRWFKKKDQEETSNSASDNSVKPKMKVKTITFPNSEIKESYRIDVLVPLYLDEAVVDDKVVYKDKFPNKLLPGVFFVEGLMLAADTLEALGYKLDIHIHDITAKGSTVYSLINSGQLRHSDLIIGAVQSDNIPEVAKYAKFHNINFVSALSPSDADVRDNQYFLLTQATLESHCAWMVQKMQQKYGKGRKPLLLYRKSSPTDENAYDYLKQGGTQYDELDCSTMPTKAQLDPFLRSDQKNVIVLASINPNYAEELLLNLHNWYLNYEFEVWGLPSWKNMPALSKADAFPNIGVYFSYPFYFDETTAIGKSVKDRYRKQYGRTVPTEMVYRGYETMFWYAYLIKKYGTIFNDHLSDNGYAPFTRFDMQVEWSKNNDLYYWENKNLYLYRYQSSSYMVER